MKNIVSNILTGAAVLGMAFCLVGCNEARQPEAVEHLLERPVPAPHKKIAAEANKMIDGIYLSSGCCGDFMQGEQP